MGILSRNVSFAVAVTVVATHLSNWLVTAVSSQDALTKEIAQKERNASVLRVGLATVPVLLVSISKLMEVVQI
jgi:hypothetical protein